MNHTKLLRSTLTAGALALALGLSACGSSDETDAAATETTATETTAVETTEAPETTEAEATETTEAPETTEAEAAVGGQAVDLGEWFIAPEGDVASGTTTFTLTNSGEFPHALAVAIGNSYEELPTLENGAVDVEALGADYLGTSENIETGQTTEVTFDLPAGNYVFFCPVAFGPNSHARQGQVLSVTVD